jgi:hypothetical protein
MLVSVLESLSFKIAGTLPIFRQPSALQINSPLIHVVLQTGE